MRSNAERLIKEAQADQFAWNRLAELTDTYGNRLSGSDNLNRAIAWAVEAMKQDGLANVHTEKVMVPRWVRGAESLEIVDPPRHVIPMLGLGGSIATPATGLEADVLVVKSYDELERRSAEAKGKIVLYNAVYQSYGQTNQYRTGGASAAARHGAVGSLVRAIGPTGLRTPHTGGMAYADGVAKIPAAAISAEDAERMQRLADRGRRIRVRLKMEAKFEADVESANVVGETARPRIPRRRRAGRLPLRLVGRRHRRVGRWRGVHRDVGSGAIDEEAWDSAAADGARRALHERGERASRRQRLS